MDTFDEIAGQRRDVADFLESLDPDQWQTATLCEGWTVHDMAAHLLMPLTTSIPRVGIAMAKAKGNFDRANVALTARTARLSNEELVAGLRHRAEHRFTPPGLGPEAPLTDLLVHEQDMRIPLGLPADAPDQRQVLVLDFLAKPGTRGFVPASRIEGLRLRATDLPWERGDGQVVSGPATMLMMAIAGRPAGLEHLEGPGVDTLRDRLT